MIHVYDNITKKVYIFPTISSTAPPGGCAARALKVNRRTIYYRLTHDIDHWVIRKF